MNKWVLVELCLGVLGLVKYNGTRNGQWLVATLICVFFAFTCWGE